MQRLGKAILIGLVALGLWTCGKGPTEEFGETFEAASREAPATLAGEGATALFRADSLTLPDVKLWAHSRQNFGDCDEGVRVSMEVANHPLRSSRL